MAGYDDTRNKILETLLQRPVGTEIQPENHQDFALSLLDYIRSVELISGSTLIGIAYQDTVPVQSNDANEAYIAGVAQERTIVFQNFRDVNGDPLTVTTEEMEAKLVILIWNKQYWSKQEISANIVSQAENAYYFYNLTIRKQYASVAAMNADKVSPMGNDGRVIKRGEIVSVRNSSNSDEDAVYSYELDTEGNPSWVLQMKLSVLATRTIDGGSASVKLDTIQNKRDTKANWEANNPVLAEGEIGLVLDDKNSYKVGDGVTKWNDLPLRGYNGNVVSEFGDDFNSVMSQGGITNLLKYIVGNDNKIEIGTSNFDVLDNVKMAGFYVLTINGFPAYHMLITFDNMAHCFNQWIFGNLVLTNGTITDGAHTDGTFNIICRTYSLRTQNAGSDNVEITAGTWTKWRYLQSFFLRDKDGNIGNEEKTLGEGAIENKITVLQNNIIQLVDDLESDFNDKILDVEGDYDYLLLEYQKLIVWAGELEDAINEEKTAITDLNRELYGAIFDKYNKFTLIGDSISTFAGYIPSNYTAHYPKGKIDSVDKTYWFSLAQKLGCVVQNLSSGGSTVTNKSSLSLPKRAPLVDSDSDLIIIALGANDTNTESNEELNYSKELSDYDESIFTEAYIKGLRIILENNPNSDVLLITMDKPGRNPNNAVATKAIAEHYGVMYLDIRGTYDGELHPDNDTTDDGSEMLNIADAVVDSLISNNNKNGLRNNVAKIRDQISGHVGTYISECKSYKLDNPILLIHDNRLFSADSITITTNEYEFQSVDWYFNYPAIGERIKLTITDRVNGNDAIASFRFYDCEFDGSKVDDSHIITDKTITETGSISLEVPANTKCVVVIFHAAFGTGLAEGTKVVFSGIKIEYETVDVTYVDSKEFVSVKTDAEGKILEGIKNDGTKVFGGEIESPTIVRLDETDNEIKEELAAEILRATKAEQTNAKAIEEEKTAIIAAERIADGAVTYDKLQTEIKEVAKDVTYIENPEFVSVKTDADGRLLWWIEKDGTIGWSKGVPTPIQEELKKLEQLIKDNISGLSDEIAKSETRELSITNSLSSYGKRVMSFDEDGGVNFKFGIDNREDSIGIDLSLNYVHKNMRYVWVYMQQQAPYDNNHWGMACSVSEDAIHWKNIKEDGGCVLDMGATPYGGYLRDPSLIKVGNVFYSAFTYNIGLTDYKYGIAKSTDLYNWTICGMVKCKYNGGYILAGAPEILYIDDKIYVIFQGDINNGVFLGRSLCYLQEIPQSFLDGENTDIELECQYIDLGTCAIDYYIIKKDTSYYLFCDVGWMPVIYKGETITGPYEVINYLPQINAEGYCVFEVDGIYYLYVTGGSIEGVKMLKSSDLINWTGLTEISASYRHGSIVAVKSKIDVNKILNEIL